MLSFLLARYLGMKWLNNMLGLCFFLGNYQQSVFQRLCIFLYSLQQYIRVLVFYILTNIWYGHSFKMVAFLIVANWYFIVISVCIPLITNGVEHLFMHLFAVSVSYLLKYLSKSSSYFLEYLLFLLSF